MSESRFIFLFICTSRHNKRLSKNQQKHPSDGIHDILENWKILKQTLLVGNKNLVASKEECLLREDIDL